MARVRDGRSGVARAVAVVLGAASVAAPYLGDARRRRAPGGGARGDGRRDGAAVERVARRGDGARGVDRRRSWRRAVDRDGESRGAPAVGGGGAARGVAVALRGVAGVRADGARSGRGVPHGRERRRAEGRRVRVRRRARGADRVDGVERARPRERAALRRAGHDLPPRDRRRGRPAGRQAPRVSARARRGDARRSPLLGARSARGSRHRRRCAHAGDGRPSPRLAVLAFLVWGDVQRRRADPPPGAGARRTWWVLAGMGVDAVFARMDGRAPGRRARRRGSSPPPRRLLWCVMLPSRWRDAPGSSDRRIGAAQIARGGSPRTRRRARVTVTPCGFEHFALLAAWGAPERATMLPRSGAPVTAACPRVVEHHGVPATPSPVPPGDPSR